jgi:arginyl-tRNA synthetase
LTWDQATPLDAAERQLAAGILGFPDVVQEAAASYDPSLIANHCYDLIKAFSSFYQDHPIAKEEDAATREARLGLTALVSETVSNGMAMLGIDMPERM